MAGARRRAARRAGHGRPAPLLDDVGPARLDEGPSAAGAALFGDPQVLPSMNRPTTSISTASTGSSASCAVTRKPHRDQPRPSLPQRGLHPHRRHRLRTIIPTRATTTTWSKPVAVRGRRGDHGQRLRRSAAQRLRRASAPLRTSQAAMSVRSRSSPTELKINAKPFIRFKVEQQPARTWCASTSLATERDA